MQPNDVRQALINLSPEDRQFAMSGMAPADPGTTNWIWRLVVAGVVIVLVGTAGFLCLAFWADTAANARVSAETILSLFTGAIGFLAGLFAPSPVEKK